MSEKDVARSAVVREVVLGGLGQREAAERLGICVRQVKRLVRAYRREGDAGLLSRQRGRVSHNRLEAGLREGVSALLRGKYQGFGPTLAAEKLAEVEGVSISRETVRKLQVELGIWKPKRRRVRRVFQLRERRARFGELIQIDGSPHAWFEDRGPRCTLIVFIDDATGRMTALRFVPAETTHAYLEALRAHVLEHGVPLAVYSDRHGIFRINAKDAVTSDGKTEFGRVAQRLGMESIQALTPQAKGRVERANQTLQDRLVKEMRLQGISSMDQANDFAPRFIDWWNTRLAVEPREPGSAHRPWTATPEALEEALARREERTLSKALTFSSEGVKYCIYTKGPGTALRGAKVTLHHLLDGSIRVRYKDRVLPVTAYGRYPVPDPALDEKTLDARIDALLAARPASEPTMALA